MDDTEHNKDVDMARIRYLKPEFFKDEDLAEFPFEVRLFYAGLWCQADKKGRLLDRAKRLKVEIFPYDDVDVDKFLEMLARPKASSGEPFIYRYEVDGQAYIKIIKWHDHQKPHYTEKESTIPPHPSEKEESTKEERENQDTTKEKGKEHEATTPLSNGALTVKQPLKNRYLDFVLLTESEHSKLVTQFGQQGADERIFELNVALGSKGYKYKSHYFTILNWDRKHSREQSNVIRLPQQRNRDFDSQQSSVGCTISTDAI